MAFTGNVNTFHMFGAAILLFFLTILTGLFLGVFATVRVFLAEPVRLFPAG